MRSPLDQALLSLLSARGNMRAQRRVPVFV